jgi:predicted  nucleic acid-binding Zn-ribbon protein
MNEKFSNEIKIIEQTQTEILTLKNTIGQIKNTIKNLNSRLDEAEEIISNLKTDLLKYPQQTNNKKEN